LTAFTARNCWEHIDFAVVDDGREMERDRRAMRTAKDC